MRVIAATNQNIERLISEKKFRSDLYYRLSLVEIRLPQLRRRSADIPPLVDYFNGQLSSVLEVPCTPFPAETIEALQAYSWPGNVRELRNIVERCLIMQGQGANVTVDSLPPHIANAANAMPDALKDIPTTSFENALNGKVAGLQLTNNSGQAGSAPAIRIRGIGSMNAGNEPLYVVDGVPVSSGNTGQMSGELYSTNNIMNTLNPEDIESISVLKDAAASSLYGSRAANGVILITTKKGQIGKPVVDNIVLNLKDNSFFLDRAAAKKKLTDLAEKYGLYVNPDAVISDLSVGEQQRVEILKALYRNCCC